MATPVVMPEMGEGVHEGTIVRWLKDIGDAVQHDEPLLEVETDKVTVEICAQEAGVLLQRKAGEGQVVTVGTVVAVIGMAGEAGETMEAEAQPAAAVAEKPAIKPAEQSSAPVEHAPMSEKAASRNVDGVRVSPVVARMLQLHEINAHELEGTGRDGRITKQDVLAFLEAQPNGNGETAAASIPAVTASSPAPAVPARPETPAPAPAPVSVQPGDEIVPLTGMRRSIAEHMVRSKRTSPHATTIFEFDFSKVAKHRAAHKDTFARDGVKLTYLPYIVQATVEALKQHPLVNASWTDDGILLRRSIHVGIAVAVPNGLLVPVIRNADGLNLMGLARAINDVSERGRVNQLKPDELRDGTFTITNHGTSGSLLATPVINQPQVGILGVGMIEKRVKVIDDAIAIRPCAYMSFSFDHRVLDGATADGFVAAIKERIEHYA
ncbi:MAG: dihydrolipoamide acetyltransferase family protein [bacterium]|nr:dihydrolipoamide acetyltransferase family protein [bacterium]